MIKLNSCDKTEFALVFNNCSLYWLWFVSMSECRILHSGTGKLNKQHHSCRVTEEPAGCSFYRCSYRTPFSAFLPILFSCPPPKSPFKYPLIGGTWVCLPIYWQKIKKKCEEGDIFVWEVRWLMIGLLSVWPALGRLCPAHGLQSTTETVMLCQKKGSTRVFPRLIDYWFIVFIPLSSHSHRPPQGGSL